MQRRQQQKRINEDKDSQPAQPRPEAFSMVGKPLPTSFNRDVPQHVVQKIVDHDSAEMTAHYARLTDTTIRQHWEAARKVNARVISSLN
jgi:hypothetical protein